MQKLLIKGHALRCICSLERETGLDLYTICDLNGGCIIFTHITSYISIERQYDSLLNFTLICY